MATYVPNATQTTEPVESRTVESAALEFRALKESVNTRIATLTADFDALEAVTTAQDAKDLRVPEATVAPLPAIAVRAGKVLAFDAGGDPTVLVVGESADSSLRTDLAASSGSSLVGYGSSTVKDAIDMTTEKIQHNRVGRNLRALIDAAYPVSNLKNQVMLEKLRSDYAEFAVYTPITADGVEWARWLFTNRTNAGLSGATRLSFATLAKLYTGSSVNPYPENQTTGSQAQAATVTRGTAAATSRTGTWVGPATIGGVTDVIYSSRPGDRVVYSLTSVNRIAIRAYTNTANGGYASVVVKDSGGVEIAVSNYTVDPVGGYLRINYRDQANVSGMQYVTVASNLPTGDYTVELTVAADNPIGGRLYDAGVFGYSNIAYNAEGQQGIFVTSTSYRLAFFSGARLTYRFNGTRVSYRHGISGNAGIFSARVYTAAGVEIAADKYLIVGNTVDAYSAANISTSSTPIAGGLPLGDYYLVIELLPIKNVASIGWRLYDAGITVYNETQAGILGTDPFDLLGVSANYQGASSIPAGTMLIGFGNLEQAISVRRTTDANGSQGFAGGIHGHETAMSGFAVKVNDSVIDFAGAAVGAKWIGSSVQFDFSTQLKFVDDVSTWATSTFSMLLSAYGYAVTVKRDVTAEAVLYHDYCMMLPVSASASTGQYSGKGAGGQFTKFAIEGDINYSGFGVANDSNTYIDGPCQGAVAYNNQYAVAGFNTNTAYRNVYEAADSNTAMDLSVIQDRSDGVAKFYSTTFKFGATGRVIQPGDSVTRTNVYRCLKGFVGGVVA